MEVILREHVDNLGRRGDIVKVADGYARNYLLPRKLALPASEGNRKHVERERKLAEAREADEKRQAEAMAARLATLDITLTRRVGETEQLYGSVTASDIASRWSFNSLLTATRLTASRRMVSSDPASSSVSRARLVVVPLKSSLLPARTVIASASSRTVSLNFWPRPRRFSALAEMRSDTAPSRLAPRGPSDFATWSSAR